MARGKRKMDFCAGQRKVLAKENEGCGMLKRVVFILKKENARAEMGQLLEDIARHGVEADWRSVCGGNVSGKEPGKTEISAREAGQTQNGQDVEIAKPPATLYVTDMADCQSALQKRKLPVVLYFHEGNRDEKFSLVGYAIEKIEEVEYESLELAYLRLIGQPWTILETDRCVIRETTVNDVDSFYEIYKEPAITEYMEDLYADRGEEIAYIQDYIRNVYGFYGYGMWTVLEKAGGQVIGRAGVSWREGYDVPELGFLIAVPYQRQGYAYEVCRAILAYAGEELGFARLQAVIMEGNEKSKALCEKLGFSYEDKLEIGGVRYERMLLSAHSGG
ncbi:MAG: GNAT family N-acetyltransferase [Blautia sp.]|nr:GNAT family N-acetyltransferase [Lachnoclostridium sp.]MCM1212278.1 GNAT family N-acetyltransferase [Blautia sp.]